MVRKRKAQDEEIKKALEVIDCNSYQANEDIFNMYEILKNLKE